MSGISGRVATACAVALLLGACGSGDGQQDQAALDVARTSSTTVADTTTSAVVNATTTTAPAAATTTAAKAAPPVTQAPRAAAVTQPPATAATTAKPPPATQPPKITIQNFAFSPQALHVAAGTNVTATNSDTAVHTWTGDGWSSGDLAPTASYGHVFASPGTFAYRCVRHPSMTGTVSVG